MSKERAKKAGIKPQDAVVAGAEETSEAESENVNENGDVIGKDGLTDAERARKRYERRQAERARSRAKQQERQKKAQQNKKKRNF